MTRVGAQGIAGSDRLAFVGDTPDELAGQILLAANNPDVARTRALAALDFLADFYSAMTERESVRRRYS